MILGMFLRGIVFASEEIASCIVGPEPENSVAIKCYERTGFRYLKTIRVPNEPEPEYLMRIDREMLRLDVE